MKILFVGGDSRMRYAAEELSGNYDVTVCGVDTAGKFDVIVLPMPLKKLKVPFENALGFAAEGALVLSGGESETLTELCRERSLRLENYFADETLTLKNAALTAEAAVMLMIRESPDTLTGADVLITGYGRIAKRLARLLAAFGCKVTIAARRSVQRDEALLEGFSAIATEKINAADYDFIVNTVPAPLFSEEDFTDAKSGMMFAELASLPENPPKNGSIKYIYASGLPGKYSPRAAGKAVAEALGRVLTICL